LGTVGRQNNLAADYTDSYAARADGVFDRKLSFIGGAYPLTDA
jgi:hypothetical protein